MRACSYFQEVFVSYRYPKSLRLIKRYQYKKVATKSTRQVGQWLIIDSKKNYMDVTRLGITVSRKFGKSHQRNRLKRLVREAFRLSYEQLVAGYDLVIKPRSSCLEAKYSDILKELLFFLERKDARDTIAGNSKVESTPETGGFTD
jgi:ribonuclease P protein component